MSDSVGQYLNEIGMVPLLNAQEEEQFGTGVDIDVVGQRLRRVGGTTPSYLQVVHVDTVHADHRRSGHGQAHLGRRDDVDISDPRIGGLLPGIVGDHQDHQVEGQRPTGLQDGGGVPQMRWVECPPEEADPARSDGGLGAWHGSMILTTGRS